MVALSRSYVVVVVEVGRWNAERKNYRGPKRKTLRGDRFGRGRERAIRGATLAYRCSVSQFSDTPINFNFFQAFLGRGCSMMIHLV